MAKKDLLSPGQIAPVSGQYREVGPRGGQASREVTAVKGGTLPPTTAPNRRYTLSDATDNKSGRTKKR